MIHLNPHGFIFYFLSYAEVDSRAIFTVDAQTFIGMVPVLFSFIVLAFIFKRFLYKPVKGILQKRADHIETSLQNAAQDKATAEELKLYYEGKMRDIEIERTTILEDARREAMARADQIFADAKEDAHITRERAKRDIATEQERVKAEVYQAIVDISTDMAEKLVAASIDKSTQDKLFAEAMDELESTAFRSY